MFVGGRGWQGPEPLKWEGTGPSPDVPGSFGVLSDSILKAAVDEMIAGVGPSAAVMQWENEKDRLLARIKDLQVNIQSRN